MAAACTRWRAAALTVASLMVGTLASAPADAQCVGDCDADGRVRIENLITGVNIALELVPVSACPAFQNSEGAVDVAQLVKAVNAALDGCLGTQTCTLRQDVMFSRLELHIAASPQPLALPINGSTRVSCGPTNPDGSAECSCEIISIDPITTPLGVVCITPTDKPCPPARVSCPGGEALNVDLVSNGNIGACDGNAACASSCEAACAETGSRVLSSGCTGYCNEGTMQACSSDAECAPDNGLCNGPEPPAPLVPDICQCSCLNSAGEVSARPGEAQCNLGANLSIEAAAPCDGTDVTVRVGSVCAPQTTETASTVILNANGGTGTVPRGGPAVTMGTPVTCEQFSAGELTGLQVRGVANFFGSALGDIASVIFTECQ